MIAKRADALPAWDEKKAEEAGYTVGNRVWYEPSGFAYRAIAFTDSGASPDSDTSSWQIDWDYAPPWREGVKYKIGARVYYSNGRNTYVYLATPRYFGGGSPPNEEEDNDGIRTWELEMKYNIKSGPLGMTFAADSEFLFPVKTVAGWTPTGKHSSRRLDPEEHYFGGGWLDNGSGTYAYLGNKDFREFYKKLDEELNGPPNDYSKINSVYQSNPYDTKCYSFVELKPNDDGEYEHVREGTHMAYYKKRLRGNPQEGYGSNAVSQVHYLYDLYDPYVDKTQYYNPHGFSIEMWPNVKNSEFVLVPTAGLGQFGNLTSTNPIPNGGPFAGYYGGNKLQLNTFFGAGGQCNGQLIASDGVEQLPASPPEGGEDVMFKVEGGYSTHSPAFANKSVVIYFFKVDNLISFKPVTYTYPETGVTVVLYYEFDLQDPTVTFFKERIDSFEDSYKTETGESPPFYDGSTFVTRTIEQGNAFNFKKFQIVNTFSGWQAIGWSEG